jgi:hypothetical protein
MNKLTNKLLRIGAVVGGFVAAPLTALAVPITNPFTTGQGYVTNIGSTAGVTANSDLPSMIGSIINIALSFIGIILLGLILYAGFLWMTAGGDEDKVKKAQSYITNAVIGLIIVMASFAISNFVLTRLASVIT